jgi:3-oxoacyl-[acyl-carrier protein] reductase
MAFDFTGKTVLVTGASQGIGQATARLFAESGASLVLVARTQSTLDEVAGQIGGGARTCAMDLSRTTAAAELARAFPEVDILINNAGAVPGGGIDDLTDEELRAAYDLKLFGYMGMCRAFYPVMRARGGGTIVNVIGIGGVLRNPAYLYGATANAGLTAFTQALGSTSYRDNIRVNGVSPGPVATTRLASLTAGQAGAWMLDKLPFGRPASTDEVAAIIGFTASDLCSYVSGAILPVDGGRSATAMTE